MLKVSSRLKTYALEWKNYCNDTYENLPVWSGVFVFEAAGEVGEVGEEEGGSGMGGIDQLLLPKILGKFKF